MQLTLLQALLLQFAGAIAVTVLFAAISRASFVPVFVPEYLRKGFAAGCSALAVSALYLRGEHATGTQIVVAIVGLYSARSVARDLCLCILANASVSTALATPSQSPQPPIILLLGGKDIASRHLRQLIYAVSLSAWKTSSARIPATWTIDKAIQHSGLSEDTLVRYRKASSLTQFAASARFALRFSSGYAREVLKNRVLLSFISPHDLEHVSITRRQTLLSKAAACVWEPGVLGFRYLSDPTGTQGRKFIDSVKAVGTAIAGKHQQAVMRYLARREDQSIDCFSTQLAMAHPCCGPVIVLVPTNDLGTSMPDPPRCEGLDVRRYTGAVDAAAPLADSLLATALPMARADLQIPTDLQTLPLSIARYGLAPVADAYLRVRLSASDVERYVTVFDCFEAVIRISLFAIAAQERSSEIFQSLADNLRRPTLGQWAALLREYVNRWKPGHSELGDAVVEFWAGPLRNRIKELLELTAGSGVNWTGSVPRSHIQWLEWLTWLRNQTKGHGGLTEELASPIWERFHQAFLECVQSLGPLILDACLVDASAEPNEEIRGWLRAGRRSNVEFSERNLSERTWMPLLEFHSEHYDLGRFVIGQRAHVLIWNKGEAASAEYLDYTTGRLVRVPFPPGAGTQVAHA